MCQSRNGCAFVKSSAPLPQPYRTGLVLSNVSSRDTAQHFVSLSSLLKRFKFKMAERWQTRVKRAQKRVLDCIPLKWKLPQGPRSKYLASNAKSVMTECGLLLNLNLS